MSVYEFTGKTVKDAIVKACEELKVDESHLDIDVLEQSARGFLGIVGQRDAKIRVRRRDTDDRVREDKAPDKEPETTVVVADLQTGNDELSAETSDSEEPFWESAEEKATAKAPAPTSIPPEILNARLGEATKVLTNLLSRIPVETEIESSIQNESVYLNIKGDGSGLLIGKKGQTLDALQFMVSKIINKENAQGEKIEIVVDTENYRLRKQENLREMAVKMSLKAKKTLKPVSFNPMPPHERRLIHLILSEDREVYTKSYGEGPMRRIIVYPKRGSSNKRRRR